MVCAPEGLCRGVGMPRPLEFHTPNRRGAKLPLQGKAFGMVLRLRAYRPSSGHFVATFPHLRYHIKCNSEEKDSNS